MGNPMKITRILGGQLETEKNFRDNYEIPNSITTQHVNGIVSQANFDRIFVNKNNLNVI